MKSGKSGVRVKDAKYIVGWKLNCKAGLNSYGEAAVKVVKVGKRQLLRAGS